VLDGALPPFAIPTSLHDPLMARLDRVASMRLVAQIGAAIGREFSYPLMHAVARLPEDELQAALSRLVASELVFQRGKPPDAVSWRDWGPPLRFRPVSARPSYSCPVSGARCSPTPLPLFCLGLHK
jgi:hypothetical protein